MNRLLKNVSLAGLLVLLTAGFVYWIEAGKELSVLCSMFDKGTPLAEVTRTLDTGNLLRYELKDDQIIAESPYNLYTTRCVLDFSDADSVVSQAYEKTVDIPLIIVFIGTLLSVIFIFFQILLALGFPLGIAAWGGEYKVLPGKLRLASVASALVFGVAHTMLLVFLTGNRWLTDAYPLFALIFLLSTFANINSKSRWERRVMVPAAVILYLSFLVLSLG